MEGRGGRSAALSGPSGIGKTRLRDEITRIAHGQGIRVVRARAYETEWRTPFAVLPALLQPLLTTELCSRLSPGGVAALQSIIPGIAPTSDGPKSDRVGVREATLEAIRAEVVRGPLLIVLDDAHFADPATLEVLHRMALVADEEPLFLLLAFRDSHQRVLDPLLASADSDLTRITPFSRDEAGEALESIATFPEPSVKDRCTTALLALSGGVPLVFEQQLAILRQHGLLRVHDGFWVADALWEAGGEGRLTESVVALIRRRLGGLEERTRMTLAAAAVLHFPTPIAEVVAISGLDPSSVAEEVEALVRHRLLELDGASMAPAHAEIAQAALQAIGAHRVQAMFAAALRRSEVESGPPSPAQLLSRLRLACGAGLSLEASTLLLDVLSSLTREASGERSSEAPTELLNRVRDWCQSPTLFARLHGEANRHGHSERALRRRHAELKRLLRLQRAAKDPWVVRILVGGLSAAALLTLVAPGLDSPRPTLPGLPLGGGGILVLEAGEAIRGIQMIGPTPSDTVRVPMVGFAGPTIQRRDSLPDLTRTRILHRCVGHRGPPDLCITGEGPVRRIASSPGDDTPLGWAPDGSAILMMSDRDRGVDFRSDIFTVDLGSERVRNISNDGPVNYHAAWSPEGTRIAFTIETSAQDTLVIATTEGARLRRWPMGDEASAVAWSPDGRLIAGIHKDGQDWDLVVFDTFDGGIAHRWSVNGGSIIPIWSPDGSLVLWDTEDSHTRERVTLGYPIGMEPGSPIRIASGRLRAWIPPSPAPYLDSLVVSMPSALSAGEAQRIGVSGIDAQGRPMRIPTL
ncbi:MAG: AAA family ATPase, partial [Longimicrobiales bacterium]